MIRENIGLYIKIALLVLVILLVIVFAGRLADLLGGKPKVPETRGTEKGAIDYWKEQEYVYALDGRVFLPRESVYTYLIVGLDKEGERKSTESYSNDLQCDFVTLLVVDGYSRSYRILMLNRDTMCNVDTLGWGGVKLGEHYEQLALAHTYGDGMQISCQNVADAVRKLLWGIEIPRYVSVTRDVVSYLADSLGGVDVTLEEDYPEFGDAYVKGATVRLNGPNAVKFVSARGEMNEPTNISRMNRQRQFLSSLSACVSGQEYTEKKMEDVWNGVAPYSVTNCELTVLFDMVNVLTEYENLGIIIPEGESVKGEEFMEFYVDDEALMDVVFDLFYDEVDIDSITE